MMRAADKILKVGLVNNMPDAALVDTDRQFTSLVAESLDGAPFEIVRLHLSSVERSATALAWRDQRSRPVDTMEHASLDALIITGAEPKTADLRDEVYWPELTRLIDDAVRLELRVLCSCLASHVAVQHLTGLTRRKREQKLSGVFDFEVQRGHPLAQALGPRLTTPHSRWNSLDETDLALIGAEILSMSEGGCVHPAPGARLALPSGSSRIRAGHPGEGVSARPLPLPERPAFRLSHAAAGRVRCGRARNAPSRPDRPSRHSPDRRL